MEDYRTEQREALQALVDYSPRLTKAMGCVIEELEGTRQPDTDEYLLGIVKGLNWELQILNGTMDYLNEAESNFDKNQINEMIIAFNKVCTEKVDQEIAKQLKQTIVPFLEKLEAAAKEKV